VAVLSEAKSSVMPFWEQWKFAEALLSIAKVSAKPYLSAAKTLVKLLWAQRQLRRIRIEICEIIIKRSEMLGEAVLSVVKISLKRYWAHQTSGEAVLGVATISAKLY
jgi:hypothetical protein